MRNLKNSFNKRRSLEEYLNKLPLKAQQFVKTQLKYAGWSSKGVKWSDEEKAIYKSGPKCYRRLGQIFTTIQRTVNYVKINVGISDHLCRHLLMLSEKMNSMDKY